MSGGPLNLWPTLREEDHQGQCLTLMGREIKEIIRGGCIGHTIRGAGLVGNS